MLDLAIAIAMLQIPINYGHMMSKEAIGSKWMSNRVLGATIFFINASMAQG
jgi:hypothetical protein